jgi:hypothetical protein
MLDALFSAISHPGTPQAMHSGDVAKTIYVVTSILIVAFWVVVIGGGK